MASSRTICLSGGRSIKAVLVSLCENNQLFSKKIILSDERDNRKKCDSNYHALREILPNYCDIAKPEDMWRSACFSLRVDLALLGFGYDGHICSIFQE